MVWHPLQNSEQLHSLIEQSVEKPIVIFKHSTRCVISSMAKDRLERQWQQDISVPFYYLDLLQFRAISNEIADVTNVEHQSPQIILLLGGKCVYTASHGDINIKAILSALN
jgi:bacillithiol system protein YtxJ